MVARQRRWAALWQSQKPPHLLSAQISCPSVSFAPISHRHQNIVTLAPETTQMTLSGPTAQCKDRQHQIAAALPTSPTHLLVRSLLLSPERLKCSAPPAQAFKRSRSSAVIPLTRDSEDRSKSRGRTVPGTSASVTPRVGRDSARDEGWFYASVRRSPGYPPLTSPRQPGPSTPLLCRPFPFQGQAPPQVPDCNEWVTFWHRILRTGPASLGHHVRPVRVLHRPSRRSYSRSSTHPNALHQHAIHPQTRQIRPKHTFASARVFCISRISSGGSASLRLSFHFPLIRRHSTELLSLQRGGWCAIGPFLS